MTSLTRIAYGSRVRRHGRSRRAPAYQRSSALRIASRSLAAAVTDRCLPVRADEARRRAGIARRPAIVKGMTASTESTGLSDIETRADCERLVRTVYARAFEDPIIRYLFVDVARLPLRRRAPPRPRSARPADRLLLGDDPARRALLRRRRVPPPRGAAPQVPAARRALRALARALARHRRRPLRRRAGRSRQGARRARRAGLPRAPAVHALRGRRRSRRGRPARHAAPRRRAGGPLTV